MKNTCLKMVFIFFFGGGGKINLSSLMELGKKFAKKKLGKMLNYTWAKRTRGMAQESMGLYF